MANPTNKDPFMYQQEKCDFIQELRQFHISRGTPFGRIPVVREKEVDLLALYRRVIKLGGWRKVNEEEKWDDILPEFGFPRACTNGAQALKKVYIRYLDSYEKINFLGIDPDQRASAEEETFPARKKLCLPLYGVPLTYKYDQHKVSDSMRQNLGFSSDFTTVTDYDKLELALLSGLPNEVDFVINVCTLLSNESRHILRLDKARQVLELLLAHIGIFEEEPSKSLEKLYENGWRKFSNRDFVQFWFDTVYDDDIRQLISYTRPIPERHLLGSEVLNLGREEGVHDKEGQRITQLMLIFRNLSFESKNMNFLASHHLMFRFLLLCIHNNYGSLRQMALDTLGNLAEKMILLSADDVDTKLVLDLICKCLHSEDKFDVVRALEILSKLCNLESNETVMAENLETKVYEAIVRYLTVYDIQLIVCSLEALYQLSELGEVTTTKIAAVRHAVDLLVALITIEAQSFGPNSLVGIKVVEYCPPAAVTTTSQSSTTTPASQPLPSNVPPTNKGVTQSAPGQTPSTQSGSDLESTTCNWLQANYELKTGSVVSQLNLYADYINFGKKLLPQVLPSQAFLSCVKVAFPQAEVCSTEKDGTKEASFRGLCKRLSPLPFAITIGGDGSKSKPNADGSSIQQGSPQRSLASQPQGSPRTPAQSQPVGIQGPFVASAPSTNQHYAPSLQSSHSRTGEVLHNHLNSPNHQNPPGSVQAPRNFHQPFSVSQQNLPRDGPVATTGMQEIDSSKDIHRSADINRIKSLLAKKLRHNQTLPSHVPTLKASDQNSTPHFVTGTYGEPQVALPNFFESQQPSQPEYNHYPPAENHFTNSQPTESSFENAPGTSQCYTSYPTGVTSNITSQQWQPASQSPHPATPHVAQKSSKSKKGGSSPSRSPASLAPRSASPKSTSPKRRSSQGSRPSSPRAASPRSPRSYDLEVCGEVERAKDIVQRGLEAKIERVENRGLQLHLERMAKAMEKPSSVQKVSVSQEEDRGSDKLLKTDPVMDNSGPTINLSTKSSESCVHPVGTTADQDTAQSKQMHLFTEEKTQNRHIKDRTPDSVNLSSSSDTVSPALTLQIGSDATPHSLLPAHRDHSTLPHGDSNMLLNTNESQVSGSGYPVVGSNSSAKNSESHHFSVQEDSSVSSSESLASIQEIMEVTKGSNAVSFVRNPCSTNSKQRAENQITYEMAASDIVSSSAKNDGQLTEGSVLLEETCERKKVEELVEKMHSTVQDNYPALNGGLSSPEHCPMEIVPSPTGSDTVKESKTCPVPRQLFNGVKESVIEESKTNESLPKLVEKLSKLNGIIHHVGNGDNFERVEEKMEESSSVVDDKDVVSSMRNSGDTVIYCAQSQGTVNFNKVMVNGKESHSDRNRITTDIHVVSDRSCASKTISSPCVQSRSSLTDHSQSAVSDSRTSSSVLTVKTEKARKTDQNKSHLLGEKFSIDSRTKVGENFTIPQISVSVADSSRDSEQSCDSFGALSPSTDSVAPKHSTNTKQGSKVSPKISSKGKSSVEVGTSTPKAAKRPKKRSRSTTGSSESRGSTPATLPQPDFMCEWNGCKRCFETAKSAFLHVYKFHIHFEQDGICKWENCEKLERKSWSLITHVQDHHCSEQALRAASQRRLQAAQAAQTGSAAVPAPTVPALVYPHDAAMQAIRRFAARPPYPELLRPKLNFMNWQEPREGPVTKHIRLTAGLILRNLARYSALGRSLIKRHERHINYTAMSALESSSALANCLWEVLHDH